ncbi:MAG: endonuclease/exonuclease/phosphatase family protein [Deltaproteobacteria bacterium]|nr:endonuclease/exonuclease/phosphatase family protein [Deltaproteobacteria bacterium]
MKSFRIATFNVWHGLAGRGSLHGLFGFREFESAASRDRRWRKALRDCEEINADIFLFQELNPVSVKGKDLVLALGGEFQGCVDQSGLKFFSLGFPHNLASGLGILVRSAVRAARQRDLPIRVPQKLKLSGGFGKSGESVSFHLDEQRYAQFSSVFHESLGRLMIVNTHLHHGFEKFPELLRLLTAATETGRVREEELESLNLFLENARDRRLSEMDRILEVVDSVDKDHDGVLIGGDFNSVPFGAAATLLSVSGFEDLYARANGQSASSSSSGATWDPVLNPANHRIQQEKGFQFPLPDFGNPELLEVYREFDRQPRRIDFLFARGSLLESAQSSRMHLTSVRNFGLPDPVGPDVGLAASDHFGVVATWVER